MGKRQTTFAKQQRERDKRAKAAAKAERKAEREQFGTELVAPADQASIIEDLDRLHSDFDAGRVSADDFEKRRAELLDRLTVD